MKPRSRVRTLAMALGLLAVLLAVPAALVSAWAWAKARMPYNEEGQHFDGLVVHHAGSEYVYAAVALVLWLLVGLAIWGARRAQQR
ncbi:hypothetical protein [Hydrogenophaga sp.]|uniref:hypothetical protein n=1 Tax=Hydrogenophaga sp. TaxID=1904254 RepID=UPI00261F88CC|nr:hypothetical protein [Hydrogenophaga sp.]